MPSHPISAQAVPRAQPNTENDAENGARRRRYLLGTQVSPGLHSCTDMPAGLAAHEKPLLHMQWLENTHTALLSPFLVQSTGFSP